MRRPLLWALGLIVVASGPARAQEKNHLPSRDEAMQTARAAAHNDEAPHAPGNKEADENPDILEFKPSLAISTLLIFGILLGVLWKFAWGPLSKALDAREAYNQAALAAAEHARAEGERLLAEHKAQLAGAADQIRALIDQGRKDAETAAQSILTRAQAEAEHSRDQAKKEIDTARDQALAEIWTKTADLAVGVAGKVLGREMSGDDRRRLADAAIQSLPAANGHRA